MLNQSNKYQKFIFFVSNKKTHTLKTKSRKTKEKRKTKETKEEKETENVVVVNRM